VLLLLAHPSASYEQIAGALGVSVHSINTYVRRLSKKLGVSGRGREAVVAAARQYGLLDRSGDHHPRE
jgi:DNA-binding CsgD family transcriptional regulator